MLEWAVAAGLWLGMPAAESACELYWRDMTGYGWEEHLRVPPQGSLQYFAENAPSWWPDVYDARGRFRRKASLSELSWSSAKPPADVQDAGSVAGRRLYRVSYASQHQLLVWERQPGAYCPFALLVGDDTVVAYVSKVKILSWQGQGV